jgi:hypothetical protein
MIGFFEVLSFSWFVGFEKSIPMVTMAYLFEMVVLYRFEGSRSVAARTRRGLSSEKMRRIRLIKYRTIQ